MKPRQRFPKIAKSPILPIATAALAIAIFVIDTKTDLEIAVAALYVAVVLLSVGFCQKRGVILVSAGCMVLTIVCTENLICVDRMAESPKLTQ